MSAAAVREDPPSHVRRKQAFPVLAKPAGDRRSAAPAAPTSVRTPAEPQDYNVRILWPLVRWLEGEGGPGALQEVLAGTDLSPDAFSGKTRWVSASIFEAILERARARIPDEAGFKRACTYRIREAYGPIRFVLWAASPSAIYAQSVKTYGLVSRVGRPSVVSHGATHVHVRMDATAVRPSRLTCLMRQAQTQALPGLWGLPAATLREEACIARGDATCEEHYQWHATRSLLPLLLGAAATGLVGVLLCWLHLLAPLGLIAFAAFGAALGAALDARRVERLNWATHDAATEAIRTLADEESEARRELLEMQRRQKDWTRLVEDEMGARSEALQKLASGIRDLHESRTSKLLGVSHDLRNPLSMILLGTQFLQELPAIATAPDAAETLRDMVASVERMRKMLADLVELTKGQRDFVALAPQRVDLQELKESLHRRLRALAYGRDLRTAVFTTREAPAYVMADPLALDRIVDNLITNAAKYTDRGSIIVELDGDPDELVLKVSDTGRGIAPDAIERIFEPGASHPDSRRGDSFGVGLSVVVQLLDQMGGRLEVMSTLGTGTIFWVRVPREAPPARPTLTGRRPESSREPLSRVVTVRNSTA